MSGKSEGTGMEKKVDIKAKTVVMNGIKIQDVSVIERMEQAIYEHKVAGRGPTAIALGPHEYLSFSNIEIAKGCRFPCSASLATMSFLGLPVFSIEIDGVHILGERTLAVGAILDLKGKG
jgi:hypothetical protein